MLLTSQKVLSWVWLHLPGSRVEEWETGIVEELRSVPPHELRTAPGSGIVKILLRFEARIIGSGMRIKLGIWRE